MDVYTILAGNEDPALWWLTYVEQMIHEYGKEHEWQLDDDPQATLEAIGVVKTGCVQLRIHLIERHEQARLRQSREVAAISDIRI